MGGMLSAKEPFTRSSESPIGLFGLGIKSVLSVSDPRFFFPPSVRKQLRALRNPRGNPKPLPIDGHEYARRRNRRRNRR
jgi:hypothetical protein